MRVRKGSEWVDIDTTLRFNPDGSVSPVATASELAFSGGGSGPAIRLAKSGRDLTLRWPGKPLPTPVLNGDTATYRDVMPGVDLQLRARPDGFAQLLVVKDAVAARNPALRSIRWGVQASGLSVRGEADGRFVVADEATGEPVWFAPESFMWDSASPIGTEVARGPARAVDRSVKLRAARVGVTADQDALTVVPDPVMLTDPNVAFPLYIDPELVAYSTGWTQVNKCAPDTSYWSSYRDSMRVGLEWGTSSCVWRSMIRFGLDSITNQGQRILYAQFRTLLDHSASCTPTSVELWWIDWIGKGEPYTWNNTNSFGMSGFWNENIVTAQGNANETGNNCPVQPDMWMEFGGGGGRLRDIIQATVDGTCGCVAFGLKAAVENDQSKWKRFYPADSATVGQRTYLQITHDRPPAVPSVQPLSTATDCYKACTSPARVRTTTPTLRVSVSDPEDSGVLSTLFEVRTAASDTATLVVDNSAALVQTADPGTATWKVPSGKLANGGTYYWRAATKDEAGVWGPWTGWQSLTVDTSPPVVEDVTSTQYPKKKWGAQVGTQDTFTFIGGSDVHEFTWWVDGGATTTVPASGTTSKTASVSYTPATDMVHTLFVTAKDTAGNTSGNAYAHQFWVSPVPSRCWYWKLDETTGTSAADSGKAECSPGDATVTSVPGTLSGSVAWASGHRGNAASFAGGGIEMGQPVVDGNKSFTVTAWVKPTNLAAGDQTAVAQHGSVTSRFQLHYDAQANDGAGGWCFTMRATDSSGATPVSACATGMVPDDDGNIHPPQDNVWVHLAGVYNAVTGKIEIHVMGNPISCSGEMVESAFTGTWSTFGQLVIGQAMSGGAASERWAGFVDEVRLYPIALSTTKICQLASQ